MASGTVYLRIRGRHAIDTESVGQFDQQVAGIGHQAEIGHGRHGARRVGVHADHVTGCTESAGVLGRPRDPEGHIEVGVDSHPGGADLALVPGPTGVGGYAGGTGGGGYSGNGIGSSDGLSSYGTPNGPGLAFTNGSTGGAAGDQGRPGAFGGGGAAGFTGGGGGGYSGGGAGGYGAGTYNGGGGGSINSGTNAINTPGNHAGAGTVVVTW